MLFPKYIVLHGTTDASQLSSLISRQDYELLRDFLTQTFGAKPDEIDQSQLLILQLDKGSEFVILNIRERHSIELFGRVIDQALAASRSVIAPRSHPGYPQPQLDVKLNGDWVGSKCPKP